MENLAQAPRGVEGLPCLVLGCCRPGVSPSLPLVQVPLMTSRRPSQPPRPPLLQLVGTVAARRSHLETRPKYERHSLTVGGSLARGPLTAENGLGGRGGLEVPLFAFCGGIRAGWSPLSENSHLSTCFQSLLSSYLAALMGCLTVPTCNMGINVTG